MAEASADPRVGEVLEGRYRILERLASGGMGVVYRGERLHLGRAVAVKFLDAANAADDNSRARFEREAKAMSRLSHPHCVSVIDFGVATGSAGGEAPYIVMDYVTGQPLLTVIAKSRLKAHRVVHIMKQVMAGLAHAHNQEVIHRDIKPANIMLTEATGTGDFVRILDFGLAKLRGASSLSSANIVIGTPSYMSPEQGSGKPIDGRTDIYSSGVILYELLMGHKPFVGEDAFATLRLHQSESVPLLGDIRGSDEMRAELDTVIQKAMAKKPGARFQTALEMGKALARLEEAYRPRLKRARGKSLPKRDPARATTEIPTATTASAARDENTSVISGASESREDSSHTSAIGGFFRTVLALAVIAGLGVGGWYYWQQRTEGEGNASNTPLPAAETSAKTAAVEVPDARAASPDAAPAVPDAAVVALVVDAAAIPDATAVAATPDAGVAIAVALDAGVLGGEPDAGPPPSIPAVLPTVVSRYSDVEVLLAAGKRDAARAGLRKLLKADRKNGFYYLKLGHLDFEAGAWSSGLSRYRSAIKYRRKYRSYATINRNAIRALGSNRTRWAAQTLITGSLGRAALPYLRRAAKSDKSTLIRKRAALVVKKIR